MSDKIYSFRDFLQIVKELRGDHGCPWDKAQTHSTLKKYLAEESQEVMEGIDIYESTGDWDNLCEELGDLMLQVVLHSVIAEEEGLFTMEDVIQGISEKMVRRHPHVFGDAAEMPDWEAIKALEKLEKRKKKA